MNAKDFEKKVLSTLKIAGRPTWLDDDKKTKKQKEKQQNIDIPMKNFDIDKDAPGAKVKRGDSITFNSNSFKRYNLRKDGFKQLEVLVKGLKGNNGKGKVKVLGSVKTPEGILYRVNFIPGYGKNWWIPEKAVKKFERD